MFAECLLLVASFGMLEASPAPAAAQPTIAMHPVETDIVAWTNAQRTHYGLAPLVVDPYLVDSARRQAAWMTNTRNLTHTNMPVAENIAMGQPTTSQAVGDWMNSPGHRANILNPSYTRIGAAAYTAPDGTVFWCQQFLQ
ncbi:MAG TPA: CAP domain-containing protein [Pirellulales bacterium]|jgi:uncharacterized protein YkwD|nr:CAP domain-containing protein [Pirellulales bacterium]